MPAERRGRAALLAARVGAQRLRQPVDDLDGLDLLRCGVQDAGPGTALLGIALRSSVGQVVDGLEDGGLVEVMSLRGVPHFHRRSDVEWVRAAMTTVDGHDLEAVCGPLAVPALDGGDPVGEVAAAMDAIVGEGAITKSDLSTAVTPHLRSGLLQDCPGCGVHHAIDGLFRLATLRAGLAMVPGERTQTFRRLPGLDTTRPADEEVTAARARLVAVASAIAAPLDRAQTATWFGWSERSTGAAFAGLGAGIAEPALSAAAATTGPSRRTRLVPPRDPWLRGSDRAWLLGPHVDRRSEVFRAVGPPGVLLDEGEIVGTWRQRLAGKVLEVRLHPWVELSADQRDELTLDAEALGRLRGRPVRIVAGD